MGERVCSELLRSVFVFIKFCPAKIESIRLEIHVYFN